MQSRTSRFGYLDSLRLFAAVAVVFQHLTEHRPDFVGQTIAPLGIGLGGVAIFFFISGYVVPLSVGKHLNFKSFMVRRMFRLYPLYLAALATLIVISLTGLLPHWQFMLQAPLFDWIANLLLVQDFVGAKPFLGVSWTLIIEIIWYTLFACSLLLFGKRAGDVLDIVIPASLILLAATSLILEARIPLGRPLMVYATVMGYACYRHATGAISNARFARSVAAFVGTMLICMYVGFAVFEHPNMTFTQTLWPWIFGTTIFLGVILIEPIRTAGILNSGWIPRLGAYSYSIYLLHPIALAIASTYADGPFRGPVAITLTAMFAYAGFQWIEKPGIAWGRKFGTRIEEGQVRAAVS